MLTQRTLFVQSEKSKLKMDGVIKAILVLMLAFLIQYGYQLYKASRLSAAILEGIEEDEELVQHTQEFSQPEVLQVVPGVWVAIGYALSNSIMLEAPEGLIIVDTTESLSVAEQIHAEFRKIVPHKRITAIMYTHNHVDHTSGASAFVEDPSAPLEVWSHHTLVSEIEKLALCGPQLYKRSMRQFGTFVPVINAGLGPKLHYDKVYQTTGFIYPTHLLTEDQMDVTVSGLNMTLYHIPGETDDHMGIYLPDKDLFMCGDDIYKAFPNLYAIRGTSVRDNMKWVNSLDIIREIEPEVLLPSHTQPIYGRELVYDTLTVYRDAIQYVHDQTVRLMNKGMHPVDIAKTIRLPQQLENHPYLRPFYGTVEWSSKGVFSRYMGWFSGDPVELNALTPAERGRRMVELGQGVSSTLDQARHALQQQDYQWALELASFVYRSDESNSEALEIRTSALKALAGQQTSANGRSYFLSTALEDNHVIDPRPRPSEYIMMMQVKMIFNVMSSKVRLEDCGEKTLDVLFNFTDTREAYLLTLRHGILENALVPYSQPLSHVTLRVTTTELMWKQLLAKTLYPVWSYLKGDILFEPSVFKFTEFFDCFDKD